ncbi:Glycosyltransferase involved in cell wall bisynthesis [Algoriphagus alkaliphilus]|uniref:Glycosyltransferase involved in cell wall bisynthesis n=1 Tax=Algoriphagus alkaliphilus TaxID=279824 RepID=A0A1G5Y7C6_9BACT|nr:glycosyltransferase family 4 protein [Algoriphagus alkaliphilus]SDA77947.1 Glycosyltransferase involved in cell wall bisynthesis [Algoriphagus alkaliphilus]
MRNFLIITCVHHYAENGKYYGYGPYVREMNLWIRNKEKVTVLAPLISSQKPGKIDLAYDHPNLEFESVPAYHIQSWSARFQSLVQIPYILIRTFMEMWKSDHIHIRIPGNMGLLAMFVQVLFPSKFKTIKYAGNWDPESIQPLTYKIQRWIANSTHFTRNAKVLVYGNWPDNSPNVVPFFTASYRKEEEEPIKKISLRQKLKLVYIGAIYDGKNPEIGIYLSKILVDQGINFEFTYCGDGVMRQELEELSGEMGLSDHVSFLGNVTAAEIKEILKESHFLIFISRTEGWPKAVAEAMFWGCVPFTSAVSCVPEMVGKDGERGVLLSKDPEKLYQALLPFLNDESLFQQTSIAAMSWARGFNLEKFQTEIEKFE